MTIREPNNHASLRNIVARLLSLLAVAFVAVFVVASFNPGCLNADTLDQWSQSGLKIYHDWHPATYDLNDVCKASLRWPSSRGGLTSAALYDWRSFGSSKARRSLFRSILLLGLTFVPSIFFYLGFVGKDSFMAFLLAFAIGTIYEYHRRAILL